MNKLRCFTIIVLMLIPFGLFAQGKYVSGKVTDAQGEPLIGTSVFVQGTTNGVMTDLNGSYRLNLTDEECDITFSLIGYFDQTLSVKSGDVVNVVMKEDVIQLESSVVVGYGSVLKKNLTGAVSVISADDFKDIPVTSVNDILQGKVAGLTVTSSSGAPGRGAVTRIRGIGSIHGSGTPLYIVDGLPQDGIDYLNPSDIESVVVHKDASAAAIYGSRASNGIIMVTTKSGATSGKMSVAYDGYVGISTPWKRPYMLNAEEYITLKNLAADNAGQERQPAFATPENIEAVLNFVEKNTGSREGTDWWKEIINQNAFTQNHSVNLSGGSKNLNVMSTLAYTGQEGIVKGSDYSRLSWRNSMNANITERIHFSGNISLINEKRHLIDENNPATGTIFSAMGADPITPVFRNNLTDVPELLSNIYMGYEPNNKYSQYSGILFSNKRNPVGQIERMRQSVYEYMYVKGGANLAIDILDCLTLNSSLGFDLSRTFTSGFQPKYTLNANDYANENKVVENNTRQNYFMWEETLNFSKKWGDFNVGALLGFSMESTSVSTVNASAEGVVNNNSNMAILNAANKNYMVSGYPYSNSLMSYFGRVTFDYKGRYLLTANIRRDGSSKFAAGYKWGTFPSVSAAWRFSDEPFLENLNWLSDGKLRVSYGEIGNQNISGGGYKSTYGSTVWDYYNFGTPSDALLGGGIVSEGNAVLRWETSKQFDVGLDLSFLDNRIEFMADYFYKRIDDMLMVEPLPTTLGFEMEPYSNVGSMKNSGWEFAITHRNRIGELDYSVSGNISAYANEVLSLGNGDAIYGSAYNNNTVTKTEVGMPVGYFYGYVTNGIFQNAVQVEGSPQRESAIPGDVRYKDLTGDDELNDADRTYIGSPWPDFVYGLTLNLSWKGLDFSAFFQGSQGNDIMNMTLMDFESGTGYMNARKGYLDRAWTGEGSTDKYHLISAAQRQNLLVSDYYLEDGSYLRLKNIQIGYNFCDSLIKCDWLNYFRLYVSVQNAFTITSYSGLDPEIGSSNAILNGIDQGFYPQSRVYTIGLNLKF